MATPAERRALFYSEDPDYDPCIIYDINAYLIENFKMLTLKQRRAVWTNVQNDEEFDWEPIQEQIDDWVEELFDIVLETEEEDGESSS